MTQRAADGANTNLNAGGLPASVRLGQETSPIRPAATDYLQCQGLERISFGTESSLGYFTAAIAAVFFSLDFFFRECFATPVNFSSCRGFKC